MLYLHKINIETELGTIVAASTKEGICILEFADSKSLERKLDQIADFLKANIVEDKNQHLEALSHQLGEYFTQKRKEFDIPLDLYGTEFQKKVWMGLLKIPYGTTISYAKQAARLCMPKAVRAVANANGQNKISIILPCHRVIGSDGTLTGYGGGLWRKQKLLKLENAYL